MTTQEQAQKFFPIGSIDEIYGKVLNVNTNGFLTVTFENDLVKAFEYDKEFNLMMEI